MAEPVSSEVIERAWTLLAGAIGALVPLAFASGLTRGQVVINGGIGFATATFIGPALVEHFGLKSLNMAAAIAFLVGLVGLGLCSALLRWLNTSGAAALQSFVERFTGGSKP